MDGTFEEGYIVINGIRRKHYDRWDDLRIWTPGLNGRKLESTISKIQKKQTKLWEARIPLLESAVQLAKDSGQGANPPRRGWFFHHYYAHGWRMYYVHLSEGELSFSWSWESQEFNPSNASLPEMGAKIHELNQRWNQLYEYKRIFSLVLRRYLERKIEQNHGWPDKPFILGQQFKIQMEKNYWFHVVPNRFGFPELEVLCWPSDNVVELTF